jgi:RNA polymerase subunit RPABC4/transcription elongation factor Spt4
MTLPNDIFSFIADYLGTEPVEQTPARSVPEDGKKVCPKCGNLCSEDAAFCSECGTSFAAAAEPVCPKCGRKLTGKEKFCPDCGTKLTD